MKNLLILALATFLFACQPDSNSSDQDAAAAASEQPSSVAQPDGPTTGAPQPATTPTAAEKPKTGTRQPYQPPQSKDVLYIEAGTTTIGAGETGCVDIKVRQFNNLLSMQYTLAWDAQQLKFNAVKNFGLPYISKQNFGNNRLTDGVMAFVWIDNQLQGTTIPDGSTVFSICFDAIGSAGQESTIRFIEKPTPFEVVNINEEVQKLQASDGKVEIK
jgi:hypothetical protein